jgi:hypothetical protein
MKTRNKVITICRARPGYSREGWTETNIAREIINSIDGFGGGINTYVAKARITIIVEFLPRKNKK